MCDADGSGWPDRRMTRDHPVLVTGGTGRKLQRMRGQELGLVPAGLLPYGNNTQIRVFRCEPTGRPGGVRKSQRTSPIGRTAWGHKLRRGGSALQ